MSKAKGKTLAQILAEELKEWPENAIVTRAQWDAERAKLNKPKANAQGWIRHNRKTQPVSDGVVVEIRTRDGDFETCVAQGFDWSATGDEQIMAYRIYQPDQQSSEESPDSEMPTTTQIDGPLQWRDRITEIDAEEARLNTEHRNAIEALEEERVSLVQRLADEGLQLIGKKADKGESLPDMSDWRNWREGDLLLWRGCSSGFYIAGDAYEIVSILSDQFVIDDKSGNRDHYWSFSYVADAFKWHSRPSNPV